MVSRGGSSTQENGHRTDNKGEARLHMRIFGRNDAFLLGGFAIAVWVVSSHQLGTLLDRAREIDHSRGLQLVPALFILSVVFVVHLFRKREEMRGEASAAKTRAAEMDRLVQFGKALAQSLDSGSIRAATVEHLPLIASGRKAWAITRYGAEWIELTPIDPGERAAVERAAARAMGDADVPVHRAGESVHTVPLVAGGQAVGAIGVSLNPPLTDTERAALAAAAALLGPSAKNAELYSEVQENSVRDALTGCFNRRHSLEVLDSEVRRARRSRSACSVVMFDLDYFKRINDRFGHLCGDAVLAHVGQRMKAVLRSSDTKCRYGGEEFLVVLPDTPMGGAHRVAEMLRKDLEQHRVRFNDQMLVVTASFGIAEVTAADDSSSTLIARADAALYHAKQDGRNCVRTSKGPRLEHAAASHARTSIA
jgi:diguanylate cyclase (GGDEF)-like protein